MNKEVEQISVISVEEFLTDLKILIEIESYSWDSAGVTRAGNMFRSWFTDLGWDCEELRFSDEAGPFLKICNRPAETYDITFVGHMDTVYPAGTVAQHPLRMEGNFLYGPGVCDMKQGDLAMYYIARILSKDTLEKLNVCMLFTPDEEIGSCFSKEYLEQIAAQSKRVFVMEACSMESRAHCHARPGALRYQLEFRGKACHAGFMFEREHASATEEIGRWICELAALRSREKHTTINIAPISGGRATNIVADEAMLEFESRFYLPEEGERIREAVDRMAAHPFTEGVTVEILRERYTPAWNTSEETYRYIEKAKEVARSIGQDFVVSNRGGLSDANTMAQFCDVVLDGMGPAGKGGHSLDEKLDVTSIEPIIKLCVALLNDMAAEKE